MRILHTALADIHAIRAQIARETDVTGYGPSSMAGTGLVALLTATGQSYWLGGRSQDWPSFFLVWMATAALCLGLTTIDLVTRTRATYKGLVSQMLDRAAGQVAPTLVAGLLLTFVIEHCVQNVVWLLPGLWQILFSLGVFAARRSLAWPIVFVGAWYLTSGLACIALASHQGNVSPWAMGVPFGFGQLFVAAVLRYRESGAN